MGVQPNAATYSYLAQRTANREAYGTKQSKQAARTNPENIDLGKEPQESRGFKRFGEELSTKEAVQSKDIVRQGRLAREDGKKCPYSALAKDGVIEYNGVIFNCDYKHNAITLGDMSDPKKVLRINLPSGGSLKVNVNHLGDISQAAGMFTPEDLNAIMRAIHQYNHLTRKLYEIEEEESEDAEELANEGESSDVEKETELEEGSLISQINAYRTELYHKLLNNETEQKFQIGGQEMTIREWNKLLERFDESQEDVLESIREEAENRMEEAELEKMLQKLFEDRDKVALD